MIAAAFEGFRVIARSPGSLFAWWVLGMLWMFVSAPTADLLVSMGGRGLAPAGFGIWAVLIGGVATTAVFRAVMKPEIKDFAYLRLGADEARMILVAAVFGTIVALVGLAVVNLGPLGWLAAPVGLLIASPLTLVAPGIFAERRISVSRALNLGRRHVRALTVMNLIVWAMFAGGLTAVRAGWKLYVTSNVESIDQALSSGSVFGQLAINGILVGLPYTALFVILTAPAMAAYRVADAEAADRPTEPLAADATA